MKLKKKFQCKSQISSYLNVILNFRPFFAEKLQKRGKSHIFGSSQKKVSKQGTGVWVLLVLSGPYWGLLGLTWPFCAFGD